MSFPPGNEMFQFPGFAFMTYGFSHKYFHRWPVNSNQHTSLKSQPANPCSLITRSGFPHSDMSGSKLVRSSPDLIAAYHVLHRLSAPRHPPDTLITLDRFHDRCPNPSAKGMGSKTPCHAAHATRIREPLDPPAIDPFQRPFCFKHIRRKPAVSRLP